VLDRAADFPAVHFGHHHVEQDERRPEFLEFRERLPAARCGDDPVALGFEEGLDDVQGIGIVVHDQDRRVFHLAPVRWAPALGPKRSQATKPITGKSTIPSVQISFDSPEARLPRTAVMAHRSRTKTPSAKRIRMATGRTRGSPAPFRAGKGARSKPKSVPATARSQGR